MKCEECDGEGTVGRTIGGDGYGGRCAALADVEVKCDDCGGTGDLANASDTELRRLAAVHDAVEDLDDCDFDPRADLHAEDGAHLRRATYDEVAESCARCAPGADDTVRGAPIDVGGVQCYAVLHVCGGDL